MRGIRPTLAAAAVVGLALTGATAASAAITPLVQANPGGGWTGMYYRPGHISVSNAATAGVNHLAWGPWTSSDALTRSGTITQQFPCGLPTYLCPSYSHPVKVYLHDTQFHGVHGGPYFAKMRWNWKNAKGRARVAYWLFATSPGGSIPGWQVRS